MFMSLFLAADACLSWILLSITEQQVCPHKLCMQYWLKNHWPDQVLFKHFLHTNCISTSAILRNNSLFFCYVICAHAYTWRKKWHRKGSRSSSVSSLNRLVRLQTWKKAMGWCTAQWKMLPFCAKTILKESHKFEIACLKKKKKEKHFGHPETFWFWFFRDACFVCHKNTRRWMVGCYNSLLVSCFFVILRDFCISIYYVSMLSLHIESTIFMMNDNVQWNQSNLFLYDELSCNHLLLCV